MLEAHDDSIGCEHCKRHFPIRHGVIDFVLYDQLSESERRELKAMTLTLNPDKLRWFVEKENWDKIQTHFLMRGIRKAANYLVKYARPGKTLVTLGSGTGFELRALTNILPFDNIISSDISWTAAHVIAMSVKERTGYLGLFATDFDRCPIKRSSNTIGFVFEALHHADNVHGAIENLLTNNFDHLVIVEPTRNWFVNALSHVGLAMRVEYSGLKPDWINLRTVRSIARRRGYRVDVTTWWPFPDSLVPKWFKKSNFLITLLCAGVDGISCITNYFKFGAMSAIHFEKLSSKDVDNNAMSCAD